MTEGNGSCRSARTVYLLTTEHTDYTEPERYARTVYLLTTEHTDYTEPERYARTVFFLTTKYIKHTKENPRTGEPQNR